MPCVNLQERLDRRRLNQRPPADETPNPWDDPELKRVTSRVQQYLREHCPDLLKEANLTPQTRREILARIEEWLVDHPDSLLQTYTHDKLVERIYDHVAGLGPLQALLEEPAISEVIVNRWDDVWIERYGKLEHMKEIQFRDDTHVFYVAQRVLAPLGIELSAASPLATGRLEGNIRVAASVPPITPACTLNVRKPSVENLSTEAYLAGDFACPEMLALLQAAARGRANLLIAGPTGTGKSTLLRYLGQYFPREARLVVLESTAELGLERYHPHVLSMECRNAGRDDKHSVDMEQLLVHALHRRPDYIIVGEVRGPESLQLLMAMATGHPGASTVHAESPERLFDRLALAILQARLTIQNNEVLKYLAEAVDLVAYVERMADGSRKLTHLSEIVGFANGSPVLKHLHRFEPDLVTAEKVTGRFVTETGPSERLARKLARWGVMIDADGSFRHRGDPLQPESR
ncbi:MAG: CpaF family protein [Mycobacterium leprae]